MPTREPASPWRLDATDVGLVDPHDLPAVLDASFLSTWDRSATSS
jgi:hypothetical protein